jgi:hypothetical protein
LKDISTSCGLSTSGAHRRDGFVIGDLEHTSQVTVGNALKPVCPTEMLDYKSPRWANVMFILE